MLIEIKIKIGHDTMFNIHQANFKSAHLLDNMALVQFERNRCVFVACKSYFELKKLTLNVI